ncbi:hypothetical protein [Vreelandella sp. EE27]
MESSDQDRNYRLIQWRKKLERSGKGWRRFTDLRLPRRIIEFHIIHDDTLYSGRWPETSRDSFELNTPGTATFVLHRRDLMSSGVWRVAPDQDAPLGMIRRPWR